MNAQNYGFIYNELIVDPSRNIITKRLRKSLIDSSMTCSGTDMAARQQQRKDGERKLRKEIQFYVSLQGKSGSYCRIPAPFVMPRVVSLSMSMDKDPELQIQYFQDYEPLTERFPYASATESMRVIREILDHIRPLHEHSPRIQITHEEYNQALKTEVYDKIVERYSSVSWTDIYPEFERLTHVNGVKVRPLMEYATILYDRIQSLSADRVKTQTVVKDGRHTLRQCLTYIHGDIHLGNILVPDKWACIESDTPRYVFIDPRGYFASYGIFGEPHYDYAKLLFGISGYSVFDQMAIEECEVSDVPDVNELNIQIPFIEKYSNIYESLDDPDWKSAVPELTDELTRLLSLSIWLGNNSTFISPHKKLTSLMISRYLCERFL